MILPGGSSKARFISLDDGLMFEVQYNPKDFKTNKAISWEEGQNQGQSENTLQFQKGSPMTASFELVFDSTASGNQNVQTAWVYRLLALTNAEIKPGTAEPGQLEKKRPRALLFQWGGFSMKCVIESVAVTYTMFSSSGDAIRASCQVALKEWTTPAAGFVGGAGTGRNGLAPVRLVQARGGETLAQIAAAAGVDLRVLAQINGITDPLADCTGRTLSVPTASVNASASIPGVGSVSAGASIGAGGARAAVSRAFGRR
jgi:hypothetical protein